MNERVLVVDDRSVRGPATLLPGKRRGRGFDALVVDLSSRSSF